GLGARGCVHLSQDASNVAADRHGTNIKNNCDFLVGLSSSDLIEYGSLPAGEPVGILRPQFSRWFAVLPVLKLFLHQLALRNVADKGDKADGLALWTPVRV